MATISGTSGGDVIQGTSGTDVITSGGGKDVVNGQGDNDVISGGANRDRLVGGEGNDVLDGGGSNDILTGGEGDDILFGGQGDDRMVGGSGSDTMIGGDDDDIMYLATTNNLSQGDGVVDTLYFDEADGSDKVYGFESGLDKVYLDGGATYTLTNNGTSSFLTYGTTTVTFYNEVLTAADISFGTTPVFGDYI